MATIKTQNSVVKNMPFLVILGLADEIRSDPASLEGAFDTMSLEGELVYDVSDPEGNFKPVPFMVRKPLEYIGTVDRSEDAAQPVMVVSAKVSVLSSQHAHMPFRIKFLLKELGEASSVVTEPLRVFSKPNQINNYNNKTSCSTSTPTLGLAAACQPACPVGRKTQKKRTFSELLNDRLAAISAISQQQQASLMLLQQIHVARQSTILTGSDMPQDPLEVAFHNLSSIPRDSRPGPTRERYGVCRCGNTLTPFQTVRRIVRKTTGRAVDVWSEIVSLLASSIAEMDGHNGFSLSNCGRGRLVCPHEEELLRMEALWQANNEGFLYFEDEKGGMVLG